jgi:hypothetical protein
MPKKGVKAQQAPYSSPLNLRPPYQQPRPSHVHPDPAQMAHAQGSPALVYTPGSHYPATGMSHVPAASPQSVRPGVGTYHSPQGMHPHSYASQMQPMYGVGGSNSLAGSSVQYAPGIGAHLGAYQGDYRRSVPSATPGPPQSAAYSQPRGPTPGYQTPYYNPPQTPNMAFYGQGQLPVGGDRRPASVHTVNYPQRGYLGSSGAQAGYPGQAAYTGPRTNLDAGQYPSVGVDTYYYGSGPIYPPQGSADPYSPASAGYHFNYGPRAVSQPLSQPSYGRMAGGGPQFDARNAAGVSGGSRYGHGDPRPQTFAPRPPSQRPEWDGSQPLPANETPKEAPP